MITDHPQARSTDPDTAHAAAESVANNGRIDRVLEIIRRAGGSGCTLDDLEDAMPDVKVVSFSSIPARLCDRHLIHRSTDERLGRAGRMQLVYKIGIGHPSETIARTERVRASAAKQRIEIDDAMLDRFKGALWGAIDPGGNGPVTLERHSRFANYAIRQALENAINE